MTQHKWLAGGIAVAISTMAASAQATIVTHARPNTVPTLLTSTVPGVVVDTFDADTVGNQAANFTPATGSIPGGGVVAAGGNPSAYAAPVADATRFYAVAFNPAPGPITPASDLFSVPGATPQNYFGLYWGSIDAYNTITFLLNGAPLAGGVFTGADFSPADGNQTAAATNEYVDFFFSGGQAYNQVSFSTSQLNFEFDNMAYGAIPEPGSLALLAAGLLGFGVLARRRLINGSPEPIGAAGA